MGDPVLRTPLPQPAHKFPTARAGTSAVAVKVKVSARHFHEQRAWVNGSCGRICYSFVQTYCHRNTERANFRDDLAATSSHAISSPPNEHHSVAARNMNPADLTLPTISPTLTSKNLPTPQSSAQKNGKTPVPRVDLEPIYTQLKLALGDGWADYKAAVNMFVLGMRYSR